MPRKRQTGLREADIPLLKAFAGNRMKIRATGRTLGLAPMTMWHRLESIERRTGLNPKRFADLIRLLMLIQEMEEKKNEQTDKA